MKISEQSTLNICEYRAETRTTIVVLRVVWKRKYATINTKTNQFYIPPVGIHKTLWEYAPNKIIERMIRRLELEFNI